jgi:hypothetical protein
MRLGGNFIYTRAGKAAPQEDTQRGQAVAAFIFEGMAYLLRYQLRTGLPVICGIARERAGDGRRAGVSHS